MFSKSSAFVAQSFSAVGFLSYLYCSSRNGVQVLGVSQNRSTVDVAFDNTRTVGGSGTMYSI
jgi:hypothetical protein